jgi:hypothetical protein
MSVASEIVSSNSATRHDGPRIPAFPNAGDTDLDCRAEISESAVVAMIKQATTNADVASTGLHPARVCLIDRSKLESASVESDRSRLISGDDITPEQCVVFVRDAAQLGTAPDLRLENVGCRAGR